MYFIPPFYDRIDPIVKSPYHKYKNMLYRIIENGVAASIHEYILKN